MKYHTDLVDVINDPSVSRPSSKCKRGTKLGTLLLTETAFITTKLTTPISVGERLWYVKHNIYHTVICPVCSTTSSVDYINDKIRCCSHKCANQLVDPITGLTNVQIRAAAQSKTKKSIDPLTGYSKGKLASAKAANTMKSTIDEETNKTLLDLRVEKATKTKLANPPVAWNNGHHMTEDAKTHLSVIKKKQYSSGELLHWNVGNTTPNTTKQKISQTALSQARHASVGSLDKRANTINIKKRGGWIHPSTEILIAKLTQSTTPDALTLFNDKEWLYEQHITNKKTIAGICVMLGLHWKHQSSSLLRQFKKFDIPIHRYTTQSAPQLSLESFITSLGVEIQTNKRDIINPLELDIYIPQFKLAIEFNGLYWHSEIHKPTKYHLNKTELCEKQGIRLIHIFEDEWEFDTQKCKDTLLHLFGMSKRGTFARNATIREIDWQTAKVFLDEYHLLNAGNAGNYRIGAFDPDGTLIGVMVFGPQNNEGSDKHVVELRRFVTDKRNNPGLGSKMFKYAVSMQHYSKVVAFVDRRWFTGLVKSYIGFTLVSVTTPALWWTNGNRRYHRRSFTKPQLIRNGSDSSLSKTQMMLQLGYVRIWDCGKLKLQWIR